MPRSLLTAEERGRLPSRARSEAFQPALARLRRDAAAFSALRLTVPELPGGYYHDFICPEHGVELRFDAHRPKEHRCPVDGARFEGDTYDAAWRWFANHHLAEAALRLAVLSCAEGDPAPAATVRGILLGYADRYAFYQSCARTGVNPGVATYTTLDESVWSIPLAWAYSLIEDTLAPDERERILARLFVPAAEHLMRRRYGAIHNFTCWHNAAIATLGRVAGRADYIAFALEGALGQRSQLREGMLGDGLWFEGSMSYHFYSVWAILMSAVAFRHDSSTTITHLPPVRAGLLAPIACAHPDGSLPATNDCWYFTSLLGPCCHGVPPAPDFYEIGYALLGEPAFAGVLQRAYRTVPRDSVFALLFGAEVLPDPLAAARVSVLLPESGLAVLRPAADVDVMVKSGPHGGHHGHPDKLSLTGWAHGWRFSPDLGTPGYGVSSLETWYRQTLSHNTVLIDGESQPPVAGRIERFAPDSVVASVAWEGVQLRRVVQTRAEYFVDVVTVECAADRSIDWVFHGAGVLTPDSPARPLTALDGGAAYAHLADLQERMLTGAAGFAWHEAAWGLQLWLPPATGERIVTGTSPANPPTRRHGFVLRRRRAAQTVLIAVFHPYLETPRVREVSFGDDGGLVVALTGREDRWTAEHLNGR